MMKHRGYEAREDGVYVCIGNSEYLVIRENGTLTQHAKGLEATYVAKLIKFWEDWKASQPKAQPIGNGWSIQQEERGNGTKWVAHSTSRSLAFFETSGDVRRLCIDSRQDSKSKSVPLKVVMALLMKEV